MLLRIGPGFSQPPEIWFQIFIFSLYVLVKYQLTKNIWTIDLMLCLLFICRSARFWRGWELLSFSHEDESRRGIFLFSRPFRGRKEEFLGSYMFFSTISRTRLLIHDFWSRYEMRWGILPHSSAIPRSRQDPWETSACNLMCLCLLTIQSCKCF